MTVLGLQARALEDFVTAHFQVEELTCHRGWWEEDVEGEVARYFHLASVVLEPVRALLGVRMHIDSGARPLGHNEGGRASSMHLPPVQRALEQFRYLSRAPGLRGAAADFVPLGMPCDKAFRILDAAQRSGKIMPGGLFWYAADSTHPGSSTGRFLHIDDRGVIAREGPLTPPH